MSVNSISRLVLVSLFVVNVAIGAVRDFFWWYE